MHAVERTYRRINQIRVANDEGDVCTQSSDSHVMDLPPCSLDRRKHARSTHSRETHPHLAFANEQERRYSDTDPELNRRLRTSVSFGSTRRPAGTGAGNPGSLWAMARAN